MIKNIRTFFLIIGLLGFGFVAVNIDVSHAKSQKNLVSKLHGIQEKIKTQKEKQQQIKHHISQLNNDIGNLNQQIHYKTQNITKTRSALKRLNEQLGILQNQYIESSKNLHLIEEQYSQALLIMETLGTKSLDTILIAYPSNDPIKAIYASHIMNSIAQSMQVRIQSIVKIVQRNDSLQQLAEYNVKKQKQSIAQLKKSKKQLSKLIQYKSTLKSQNVNKQKHISITLENLSKQQNNLQNLLNSLQQEQEKKQQEQKKYLQEQQKKRLQQQRRVKKKSIKAPRKKTIIKNPKYFIAPVKGRIIHYFHSRTNYGTKLLGIQVYTKRSAKVRAPYSGTIVFASKFQNLGTIVILTQGSYYSTFVGLQKVNVKKNMHIQSGHIIGSMPSKKPILFYELRYNHKAINPLIKIPSKRWR